MHVFNEASLRYTAANLVKNTEQNTKANKQPRKRQHKTKWNEHKEEVEEEEEEEEEDLISEGGGGDRGRLVSWLVLWAQSTTKDYIRAEQFCRTVIHIRSHNTTIKSWLKKNFLAYLHSTGTQHGNLHPAGWPSLSCEPTQELMLATANTGKTRETFWKKCRWMDWKSRN